MRVLEKIAAYLRTRIGSLYDFFGYHYHCTVTLSVAEVLSLAVERPVNEYARSIVRSIALSIARSIVIYGNRARR